MDLFSRDDVRRLIGIDDDWCVSIFLPTHRTGRENQQDPIRLKNLLREAENQLLAVGVKTPEVGSMLEPARGLLADTPFWQHQSDGLALFISPSGVERFRVPLPLEELVIVARRFQLKPLLPLLTGDGHFHILALSQNEVRLLEASRHSVDAIELEQLPSNFRETVGLGEQDKQLQFHTRTGERGGRRAAMFHGQGPGDETTKELLAKYFRRIDDAVCGLLKDDPAPLVLAGVDYYFPIYREVSRYRHLVADGVPGNPETLRPRELHEKAWPLVEPIFRRERDEALSRYRQLAGTGRTSTQLEKVLPAAHQGRVEVAFVAIDRQQWGTFDPKTEQLVTQTISDASNEDLMDRFAIETYLKGGVMYGLPASDLPDGASLAAIYRF